MARAVSYSPITVAARRVLLDALEALVEQRDAVVLVGAQAIYLYTGAADVAIATTTKDSDIALIPARLTPEPTLEAAMTAAGFSHDRSIQQPGERDKLTICARGVVRLSTVLRVGPKFPDADTMQR